MSKNMSDEEIKKLVDKIIAEIDKSMLLGAAYDCMSEDGKTKFRNKLSKMIAE